MKKNPWGLIIYNRVRFMAAFTGQLNNYNDEIYEQKISKLQEQGYDFSCQTYQIGDENRLKTEIEAKLGCRVVPLHEVFSL